LQHPVTENELKMMLTTCRSLLGQYRNVKLALSIRLVAVHHSPEQRIQNDCEAKLLMGDLLNMELAINNVEVVLLNACNLGDQIPLIFPDKSQCWEMLHKLQNGMEEINLRCAVVNGTAKRHELIPITPTAQIKQFRYT
jgi:hypothetical protein